MDPPSGGASGRSSSRNNNSSSSNPNDVALLDGGNTSESTLAGEDTASSPAAAVQLQQQEIPVPTLPPDLVSNTNATSLPAIAAASAAATVAAATLINRRRRHARSATRSSSNISTNVNNVINSTNSNVSGCESDQTAETTAEGEDRRHQVVVPMTNSTTNTSTTMASPSLMSSPTSRGGGGGGLASSEEESVAELDDAIEEGSVAELSIGAGSCSSLQPLAPSLSSIPSPPLLEAIKIKIPAVPLPPSSVVPHHDDVDAEAAVDPQQQQPPPPARMPKAADSSSSNKQGPGSRSGNKSGNTNKKSSKKGKDVHRPMSLPKFPNPENCMWTSTHAANCPSEDRSSSLVNVLLQPLPPNFDSETQLPALEPDYKTLIRLSLWSVIDGHGGGCVATYASEVLLPHIAASVSRSLGCAIVNRGVCTVNGQLRDANALDLDGLIKTTSDHRGSFGNPNSIRYRSPFERSESDEEGDIAAATANKGTAPTKQKTPLPRRSSGATDDEDNNTSNSNSNSNNNNPISSSSDNNDSSTKAGRPLGNSSVSSAKTSVKTPTHLLGTHSPQEVAAITQAITESFLAVDEGWINSIDPVATHQTSCQSNGRWNSGACALVVFTIQRLDWTDVSGNEKPGDRARGGPEKSRCHDTSHNRDAARRRTLDNASRVKIASSMSSTVSSTSSLTTEEAVHASGLESEITETEGEEDDEKSKSRAEMRERNFAKSETYIPKESLISAPGGCSCHCYRAHDAILYTAHVGDCRAVMLGSAPPRTIKVRDSFADHDHPDTTDDEASHHSSDETECLSSSDHDADSSDDDEVMDVEAKGRKRKQASTITPGTSSSAAAPSYMSYMRRPARRSRRRTIDETGPNAPFYALPPLEKDTYTGPGQASPMIELEIGGDLDRRDRRKQRALASGQAGVATAGMNASGNGSVGSGKNPSDSSASSQDSGEVMEPIHLPPVTRPIDLTTDHSAYNPAEVTAVLRRCNNAPRAISAGVGGGIKRVAGSLAVTRALGDAYLKTPRLSFLPYKSHAPYITARPEINCRPVTSTSDKVLILATDGVWERASGEDALRWVRNFYTERIAEAERRNKRQSTQGKAIPARDLPTSVILSPNYYDLRLAPASSNGGTLLNSSNNNSVTKGSQEATEQEQEDDQNQKVDPQSLDVDIGGRGRSRKRDSSMARSPSPPSNKRRKRSGRGGNAMQCGWSRSSTVADVIVRRVLNKVRRARNINSLHALMTLPQGRARRSKHDDITSSVVDLSAFVS